MDFIINNWYKGTKNSKYIKFSHYEQCDGYKRIYFSERYDSNVGWKKINDFWASNDLEKFALNNPVTMEELQRILPKDHPDSNQTNNYEIY
jgi:hypothetical protein